MTQPLLSILIPTVIGRENELGLLLSKILGQSMMQTNVKIIEGNIVLIYTLMDKNIEVIVYCDNKELPISTKRARLYSLAAGMFSWQIDDDDTISDNGIDLILDAIRKDCTVDCITFREKCVMNGIVKSSNHSLKYNDWADNYDGFDFVRTPFYKDVIKTYKASSVSWQTQRYGEDHQWSRALKPFLSTEHHIDEEIYIYQYSPKDSHDERYGIK